MQRWANEKRQKKAQAAKEIMEQRGEARMMASQRGRRLTNTSLTEEEKMRLGHIWNRYQIMLIHQAGFISQTKKMATFTNSKRH